MLLDSRTRPIHQILESYLPPEVLAYALRLWSSEYVHQKNISMLSFVDAFYHRQPLPYSRQHIYSNLLPALMEVLTIRSTFDESTTDLYEFPDYDLSEGVAAPPHSASIAPALPVAPVNSAVPSGLSPSPQPVPVQAETIAPANTAAPPVPVIPEPEATAQPARNEKFLAFSTFVRKLMKSLPKEKRRKLLFYYRKSLVLSVPEAIAADFYEWLQGDGDYFERTELDTNSMANVVHSIYTGLCNYLGPLEADDILMKAANFIDDNFDKETLDVRDLL